MKTVNKIITSAVLCCAFLAAPKICAAEQDNPTYEKLETFARVLALVQNNYVEGIDEDELIYSAIKGMMNNLDPHSTFLTPDECRGLREDTTGQFGGVGIEVSLIRGKLTVMKTLDGTPASKAGLKEGDTIISINGEPTDAMQLIDAVTIMRGKIGTKVILSVYRKKVKKPLIFTLTRQRIRMHSVSSSLLADKIGYLKISIFQEGTERQMRRNMKILIEKAGGELNGLVLDMRKNPGGLLKEAVRIADNFLKEGVIVTTRGRGSPETTEKAHPGKTYPDFPMAVLVDSQSASAAEIVAGALQDQKRAIIVGVSTFGKGSVQTVIDMKDGSCAKLTIAKYYTPSGKTIQELGIQPDIIIPSKLSSDDFTNGIPKEIDLQGHFKNLESGDILKKEMLLAEKDPQLHTAIRLLSRWEMFKGEKKPKKK